MKNSLILTLLSATAILAPAAGAADPSNAKEGKLDAKDREFVTEAAQGGMLEVAVGQLATEKGSNPEVKKMGAMLVKDHGKANAELKKLAEARGMELPHSLDAKESAVQTELASQEGEKFDTAFVKAMVKDHQEDIQKFQTASAELKDPELRAFATKTLPVLEKHKSHADALEAKK